MNNRRNLLFLLPAAVLAIAASEPVQAQSKKGDAKRTVKGLVMNKNEEPLPRAVVQLKNTRTLQVKSFIADAQGAYHFHGLDPNIDYQLQAQYQGQTSRKRTVSTFDSREEVIYNLTVETGN